MPSVTIYTFVSAGFVIQIFSIATTVSLIHNMAPPKRAS